VIRTIRESADVDVARQNLMSRFDLSERQAQAILDMRLASPSWRTSSPIRDASCRSSRTSSPS
jgi:hypothetical protein